MSCLLPTPYPDLNAVLQELVQSLTAVLSDHLVGAYLQGSFAVGDFDPHSDVDFIIVIEEELSEEQVDALQRMHGRIFDLPCGWAQHLEGSYFPREVLHRPPAPGGQLWYLDNGSRELVQSGHCNTLVVRWQVREHGVTLAGPPPAALLAPVPVEALRREIYAVIHDWGDEILEHHERFNNRFYQGFIVLSYCRMLHSLHTGEVRSKRQGAEWAKANLDPCWSGLIERAWDTRQNPEVSVRQTANPEDLASTLELVQTIIRASEQVPNLPPFTNSVSFDDFAK